MTPPVLTDAQIAKYRAEGFLVVPGLLSASEVDAFVAYEATQDVAGRDRLDNHKTDARWRAVAAHPRIAGGARGILSADPMIVQTMYLEKRPAAAGKGTALHQDSHYLPNEPNTLMACWLAMSDTDGENGGLCVVPRSHLQGLRATHKATNDKDHQVWESEHRMRDRQGKEWTQVMYSFEIDGLDRSSVVDLEVPKGGGVFFTGMTIHGSYGNRSAGRVRRAFATHFVARGTWVERCDVQDVVPASGGA
jgi:ectoine hydroxylase-related dioxygenase (phytanoyl-CoA dioxygenase family)